MMMMEASARIDLGAPPRVSVTRSHTAPAAISAGMAPETIDGCLEKETAFDGEKRINASTT